MTEYWKSNPNYYCEYCGVWMADNPQVRAIHEGGVKHKANVAKKLADMRRKNAQEKRDREHTEKALSAIEASAHERYEQDKLEAETHTRRILGKWELDPDSGYHYNAAQRWYFDPSSKMYYGGEPPNWTKEPPIPSEARHSEDRHRTASDNQTMHARVADKAHKNVLPGMKAVPSHPMAGVGGYQMPRTGRIGGAKGVGYAMDGAGQLSAIDTKAQDSGRDTAKRKRDQDQGKKREKFVSKEEAEFLARREAARQRVQARTMATFGLG